MLPRWRRFIGFPHHAHYFVDRLQFIRNVFDTWERILYLNLLVLRTWLYIVLKERLLQWNPLLLLVSINPENLLNLTKRVF